MLDWIVRPVYAQVKIKDVFGPVKNTESFDTLGGFMSVILPNILMVAGVVAFIGVVFAGIRYIQHAGDGESDKMNKDQQSLTAALIGLMLIFGAYFILQIVSTITGYDFFNQKI